MRLPREAVKYIIIHQSATLRIDTTFESIKRYHLSLGWGNIAYHYFITADGKIRKGRNERVAGTHTKAGGMSLKSLGVCVAGTFDNEKPTAAQLKSLEQILKNLAAKYKIPKERILGHLEVPGAVTQCPGQNLLEWIERYREKSK
jgi:N-acetyl-anhydromuramyl-L-alanine amidase AmpD